MDGRNRYNKIRKVLSPIVGKTLQIDKIKLRIMIDIGSSETLVRETLKFMIDLGLIKETSHLQFKILKDKLDL